MEAPFLYGNGRDVHYSLSMSKRGADIPVEFCLSYGTHCFHHLAADGACLAGGQVTVVAIGQIDADLAGCLHLELVHCLPCLGDVQLIVIVAHNRSLPFGFPESQVAFRQESFFSFRNPILSQRKFRISGV